MKHGPVRAALKWASTVAAVPLGAGGLMALLLTFVFWSQHSGISDLSIDDVRVDAALLWALWSGATVLTGAGAVVMWRRDVREQRRRRAGK